MKMLGLGLGINKHGSRSTIEAKPAFENNQSLYFDGVNDIGSWPTASTFEDLVGGSDFTISAWHRMNVPSSGQGSKGNSLLGQTIEFVGSDLTLFNLCTLFGPNHSTPSSRDTLHCSLVKGTDTFFNTQVTSVSSYLTNNVWWHFAYTSTVSGGTRIGRVYINGVNRTSSDASNVADFRAIGITGHRFGAKYQVGSITEYTRGWLDEFVIFNEALDASAISDIYNSGCPKDEANNNVVGYWRMEEASGDALDTSINSNDISRTGPTFNSTVPC